MMAWIFGKKNDFTFVMPPGWGDPNDPKWAAFRRPGSNRKDQAFSALLPMADALGISALIEVQLKPGVAQAGEDVLNALWRGIHDGRVQSGQTAPVLIKKDIVELSGATSLRIEFDADGTMRSLWYLIPGKRTSAHIMCACEKTDIDRLRSTFESFALETARSGASRA